MIQPASLDCCCSQYRTSTEIFTLKTIVAVPGHENMQPTKSLELSLGGKKVDTDVKSSAACPHVVFTQRPPINQANAKKQSKHFLSGPQRVADSYKVGSVFLIASCHTPPFGGGEQACRSVPVNIRGEHLEARSRYLPWCSGGND